MNFVLFNPDEMRAESARCYGHPLAHTPNLDRVAAEGTRFDNCYVQHPVCSPSRCSLMTGWYPHVRGHRTLWHLLRPDEPNLLAYLNQAGYDVRWWGKNDLLAPGSWSKSVSGAQAPRGKSKPEPLYAPDDLEYYTFLGRPRDPQVEGPTHDELCVQAAIDYLGAGPKEPFCIYLPLSFPHPTYGAARRWHELIGPEDLPELRPADLPNKPDYFGLIRRYRNLDQIDPGVLRQVNAAYVGQIAEVDDLFGRLLTALEQSGHADDTAVVFYSDHGDWAGDYGLVEKWPNALDDCIVRIPCVMRVPGGRSGHVVRECVEAFDIMATVLDLAGVEPGHSHFARSLTPQLGGEPGDADRAAFSEGGYDRFEPHCFEGREVGDLAGIASDNLYYPKCRQQQEHPDSVCRATMIRTASHKLVYRAHGLCELYDMQADPCELHNVYGHADYAYVQAGLERRLLDWYLSCSDVTPFDEDPRGFSMV